MAPLPEIIAEKRNVRLGANGFYDIRLLKQSSDALVIEVAHSVFFRFIPFGGKPHTPWVQAEQEFFVQEWLRQIPATWNQQNYLTHRGFRVSLAFTCTVREEARNTQWQATVMKLKTRTAFRTSAVWLNRYPENYDAKFDSNDDRLKGGGRRQTAMIHEFGHMIGLADEYHESTPEEPNPHYEDKNSIMNLGAEVRDRHLFHFVKWAKPHIDDFANGHKEDPATMESPDQTPDKALKRIIEAKTKEEEIAAVKAWRDGGGPDEGIYFVVRRRGTDVEVPYEDVLPDNFETFEVEFSSSEEEEGEVLIWEPKSWEALEMIFVE